MKPPTALKGVKILEYCTTVSGAYCTKLMADLGAEVIKIEPPGTGDGARRKPPFQNDQPDPEKSGLFIYINTNKLGITLDPEKKQGAEIFRKLVQRADILIEDHQPGEMEKMGLGYDELKKIHPGLIMAAITPFGQTGPYRNHKAYQLNISQMSGQGYMLPLVSLDDTRPPVKVGGNNGNFDPGLVASIAVMAALFWRTLSGKGQYIGMSKLEALMSMQRVESVCFPNSGVNMTRLGSVQNKNPGGVIPCKDGYVVLITPEEHQWKNFLKLMGDPAWSREDWCLDKIERMENVERIQTEILKWAKDKTKEEIFRKGQALSVPIAPTNTAEDIVNSPQFNAREFFIPMDHPALGHISKFPSSPYRFSKTPWQIHRPAPALGEHNEQIYLEELKISRDDIKRLKESAVI